MMVVEPWQLFMRFATDPGRTDFIQLVLLSMTREGGVSGATEALMAPIDKTLQWEDAGRREQENERFTQAFYENGMEHFIHQCHPATRERQNPSGGAQR
jgi:hypothetical protein